MGFSDGDGNYRRVSPTISDKDAEPVGSLAVMSTWKTRRDGGQTDLVLNPARNVSNEVVKYGDAPSSDGVEWYSAGDNHGAERGQLDTDQRGAHFHKRRKQKEEGPRPRPPIFMLTGLVNSHPAPPVQLAL